MLQRHAEGAIIRDQWFKVGRERLLEDKDIEQIVIDLNSKSGSTTSIEEIKSKIQESQIEKVVKRGNVSITKQGINPHHKTFTNYQALLAGSDGISICQSVTPKTQTRYTAENSLISAMCLVMVVAATHYDVTTTKNISLNKNILRAPEGVKILYDMICNHYEKNMPISNIRPELILSTDDTVNYIFEGKGTKEQSFRLVASKALEKAGTRSKYKNDDSKHMCGLRVKLTYTFSAAGTIAPIFISVLGLNEREMPNMQCISMQVEGLCVGGGGVTVGKKQCGILMFMRGDKAIDIERYRFYVMKSCYRSLKRQELNFVTGIQVVR